ncbi:MAG TPA: GDP-L-fucose synthase, partial [Pseudorhodoplanes sp.]|nr:GDP-L-fucose synthase [Pseudorhodoplanes sp.]
EIARVVGVDAALRFDASKPDGTPRKLMDSERLFAMGWRPKTSLRDGLRQTYAWYQMHIAA